MLGRSSTDPRKLPARNRRTERYTAAALSFAAFIPTILRAGWTEPPIPLATEKNIQLGALALLLLLLLIPVITARAGRRLAATEGRRLELVLVVTTLALGAISWPAMATLTTILLLYYILTLYLDLVQTSISPGFIFVGSFIFLTVVGTGALMLPAATPEDSPPITLLEASFTIVSAISQTGLVVRDTGADFTRFGQIIILIWIQVGALGVIVFGALLATVFGSSFGLRAQRTIAEDTEQGWSGQLSLTKLVVFTMIVTHAFEAIGVAFFYFGWPDTWPGAPDMSTPGDRLYHAVFYSVSSFCNAGFSTTENSMQGLRTHWTPHLVMVPLIILGSIGFPVLDNIRTTIMARIRGIRIADSKIVRLNLNTKVVLAATLAVYIMGFIVILIGERTQAHVPLGTALLDAHFMTVNRTSGFDTIAPGDMGILSQLILILLMFIGGSPGSVAGGIKMMVFAVLALTVWSTIKGRKQTEVFGRTIHDAIVRKSATLITLSLATLMAVTGVLAATEAGTEHSLGQLLFEATSAFGTTGLSLGITNEVSTAGQISLMVAMFVGRVGPLAVLAGLLSITGGTKPRYEYPAEEVVIY